MPEYKVKQGDCISSIAQQHGFFWETLWNHSKNAELKRLREDPNILCPGDCVFIPERQEKQESVQTDCRHRFKAKNVPAYLKLRLIDLNEQPRNGVNYILNINGTLHNGTTDDNGCIDEPIPPNAEKAILTIVATDSTASQQSDNQVYNGPTLQQDEPETENEQYEILLGCTDPIDEDSGIRQRLANLGYDTVGIPEDQVPTPAMRGFQSQHELEETDSCDNKTKKKLKELYGH